MTLPSPVQDWIDRAEKLLKELKESGGSSGIAKKLETARIIRLTGGVSGQTQFDGSQDVDISTEVAALTNEEIDEILKEAEKAQGGI